MRPSTTRWLAASLLLLVGSARASGAGSPAPLAVVRDKHDGKLVNVPVRINGSRVLWFVLDSGAQRTVIDSTTARTLGLTALSEDRETGVGRGTVDRLHVAPIDVSIGSVHLAVGDPWVMDLSHTGVKHRVDGLLGAGLLMGYVVRVDPLEKRIAIYDPATFHYGGRGATVPLEVENRRFYVRMRLTLSNGLSVVHRMLVDTGSEHAIDDSLARQSPERREALQGQGLGAPFVDYTGMFETVQIGPFVIRRPWGPSGELPAVGMEILRRFTMTFDASRGKLYLTPNRHIHDPLPAPAG